MQRIALTKEFTMTLGRGILVDERTDNPRPNPTCLAYATYQPVHLGSSTWH